MADQQEQACQAGAACPVGLQLDVVRLEEQVRTLFRLVDSEARERERLEQEHARARERLAAADETLRNTVERHGRQLAGARGMAALALGAAALVGWIIAEFAAIRALARELLK